MFGMMKTFAILGVVGGSALLAQPAKADNVRVGFGISVAPVRTYTTYSPAPVYYSPAPVYYSPAPVVTSYYPAPTYVTQSYYPQTVVYAPAPVYVAPSVPYYAPVYSSPVYYSRPSVSFDIGFLFGGGGRDRDRGGHHR